MIEGRTVGGVVAGVVGLGMLGVGAWETYSNGPATRNQILHEAASCQTIGNIETITYAQFESAANNTLLNFPSAHVALMTGQENLTELRACYGETRTKVEQMGLGPYGPRYQIGVSGMPAGFIVAFGGFVVALSAIFRSRMESTQS